MKLETNNNIISKDKLKDVLINKTAIKTLQNINIVEKIISHSFKSAAIAIKTNREVEISGFGIFKTNDFRAKQLLEKKHRLITHINKKLEKEGISDSSKANYEKALERVKQDIICINAKLKTDEA